MLVTFDSNVLVYTIDAAENTKHARAAGVVARAARNGTATFLLQALAEFSNVTLRKLRIEEQTVLRHVGAFEAGAPVRVAQRGDISVALDWVGRYRLPFWDALLCATADRAGIRYLLSDDFQDGRRLGGLTIVNPFRPENDALIDRILPA